MGENVNSGGRRYKHPDAGLVVRALFASKRVVTPDPRMDALLSAAILLKDQDEYEFSVRRRRMKIERLQIQGHGQEDVIYVVSLNDEIVFDAAYLNGELVMGAYRKGDWEFALRQEADTIKMTRRKALPRPAKEANG